MKDQMDDCFHQESEGCEDLSFSNLTDWPVEWSEEKSAQIKALNLSHNSIMVLPSEISHFVNLISLDISNNSMTSISAEIVHLPNLKTLLAKNNAITTDSLPKDLGLMSSLEVMNLNGNRLEDFPMQFTEMPDLKCLYLGGNQIRHLPRDVRKMSSLRVLHLGGNHLHELPVEIGCVSKLTVLNLCDNHLQSLPTSLISLRHLKSLMVHNNEISVLPPEIVGLDLMELSLRNNPLIFKFVKEMVNDPPSLLELAGRTIKSCNIPYYKENLPITLKEYLNSSQQCVNPKCKGVYFTSHWEHVKFVDFCGKYRLPLMQYLCSPTCTPATPVVRRTSTDSSDDEELPIKKMKRVLLG